MNLLPFFVVFFFLHLLIHPQALRRLSQSLLACIETQTHRAITFAVSFQLLPTVHPRDLDRAVERVVRGPRVRFSLRRYQGVVQNVAKTKNILPRLFLPLISVLILLSFNEMQVYFTEPTLAFFISLIVYLISGC